jgi:hypothetical protein
MTEFPKFDLTGKADTAAKKPRQCRRRSHSLPCPKPRRPDFVERDKTRSAMEYRDPLCRPTSSRNLHRSVICPLKLRGARRSGAQIRQAQMLSRSSMLCSWPHLPQETGIHVENEASHRDIVCDPRMRSDFFDLIQGIFLGVLKGEKAHRSRGSISG